jgi:hypothetical protein
MGLEEVQVKSIQNILNIITAENFPNFGRDSCPGTGGFQDTKHTRPEKNLILRHTKHEDTMDTEQEKNIKSCKRVIFVILSV